MKWFKWRDTRWGAYTFAICSGVLFFLVLQNIDAIWMRIASFFGFFLPVLYGLIMAYILDFLVVVFEKHVFSKMQNEVAKRNLSVIVTIILFILFMVLLNIALIPSLISSITEFTTKWDRYVRKLTDLVNQIGTSTTGARIQIDTAQINLYINKALEILKHYYLKHQGTVVDTISSIGTKAMTFMLSFILAIYFLIAKHPLINGFKNFMKLFMKEKNYNTSAAAFRRINGIFSKYVVCEILDALFVGVANAAFMLIARMPYVAVISVVVGVTNLAPTFGPIAGGLIGSLILILADPYAVIPFLVFTFILQTFDGYVVKPKFYGGALSVPSVWVLVAIIVMGRMFGVIGILLAIPVAAIITYWIRDAIEYKKNNTEPDPHPVKSFFESGINSAPEPEPRSRRSLKKKKEKDDNSDLHY